MNPKKIWANFAVKDVARTRKFYKDLGFKSNENHDNGGDQLTSFLFGDNAFVIHFFAIEQLEKNIHSKVRFMHSENEIMFTLSADSKEEADAWAEEVRRAGGSIVSEPVAFGNNWYGFEFADPDGHKFNVFCR